MIWTKTKPVELGYFWLRRTTDGWVSEQPPRVVKIDDYDGNLCVFEPPEYNADRYDFPIPVERMSEGFEWSDIRVSVPSVAGSCGCSQLGVEACSSCDTTIPLPEV